MIRLLSINRLGPLIVSMNDLFLSLSTGILIILHHNYYVPMIVSEDNDDSLYSILYSILFVCAVKTFLNTFLTVFSNKKVKRNVNNKRDIPLLKLIYSAGIKATTYLCFIFLLVTINTITFSLTIFLTLLFIFSLQYASKNNQIINILWKGRSFGTNKIKTAIFSILILVSIALQPLSPAFIFQLHFEIFIIFTSSLMIFSYYYLHKLFVTVSHKDALLLLLSKTGSLQCVYVLLLIVYYALMQEKGMTLQEQLRYFSQNAFNLIGIVLLDFIYELVLIQSIKKVALNRLVVTQITGLLWFNIYQMVKTDIQLKHYISVIVMLFVLLVNMELFSQENIKKLLDCLFNNKKKKKSAFTEMSFKQSENDH